MNAPDTFFLFSRARRARNLALPLAIVMMIAVTLGGIGVASASQNPTNCLDNDFIMQVRQDPSPPYSANQVITYSVSAANDGTPTGCDISGVKITLTTPDGVVHTLQTNGSYPFPTPIALIGSVTYTVNPGDAQVGPPCTAALGCIVATFHAEGTLHDDPARDDAFSINKQLSGPIAPTIQTHYLCYEVKRQGLAPGAVPVVDQFGSNNPILDQLHKLCNPVNKNDEDPDAVHNKPVHLDGYDATSKGNPAQGHVVSITDQFGTTIEKIGAVKTVFVPAAKSLVGPVGPLANPGHGYVCYSVRFSGFQSIPTVKVQDEFGTLFVKVDQPNELCDPADVNGSTQGAASDVVHLNCYDVDLNQGQVFNPNGLNVWINDMFQARQIRLDQHVWELCVPASKKVIS